MGWDGFRTAGDIATTMGSRLQVMLCKAKLPSQLEELGTEHRQHGGPEWQPVVQRFGNFYQAVGRHLQAVCVGRLTVISKYISV